MEFGRFTENTPGFTFCSRWLAEHPLPPKYLDQSECQVRNLLNTDLVHSKVLESLDKLSRNVSAICLIWPESDLNRRTEHECSNLFAAIWPPDNFQITVHSADRVR